MREQRFSVVVPTTGGQGLGRLLRALADSLALADRAVLDLHEIVVVDDRPGDPETPLELPEPGPVAHHVRTVAGGGVGPAAARNAGWRSTSAPWIVILEDDTEVTGTWADDLVADLEGAGPSVGAVTARDADRAAVTDVAYRRELLEHVNGFEGRASRLSRRTRDGWLTEAGTRVSHAPARPAGALGISSGLTRAELTTPLLAGAAGLTVAGLAGPRQWRWLRRLALAGAAGLGVAAVLTSSPET